MHVLEHEIEALESGIEALESGMKALESGIEALERGMKALERGIEALERGIEALEHVGEALECILFRSNLNEIRLDLKSAIMGYFTSVISITALVSGLLLGNEMPTFIR